MLATWIFGALAALSLGLTLWQWLIAMRFPLHRRVEPQPHAPAISILKPLKGAEPDTMRSLQSWFQQAYQGSVQLLFGVASADDPVCGVVKQLLAQHPGANARLVICPENLGANPKVSTLIQLERLIRHEVTVVSDADVIVPPDFLAQVVAPLRQPGVGLVNCFYQFEGAQNLAMRWEAFAVNADFWSQVLQAQTLKPLDFALGAVMALPKTQLEKIGGMQTLVDYLADDYQLGHRVAQTGTRVVLCPVVVTCHSAPMSWSEVWAHQVRWARTIRVCQPVPYFFSLLSNATLWPLLWLSIQSKLPVAIAVAACLLVRMAAGLSCEHKLTRVWKPSSGWLAILKDLFQIPIWAQAFIGNHITWRGQRYRVLRGGKLLKC